MAGEHTGRDVGASAADYASSDTKSYIEAYVERLKQSGMIRSAAVERAFRSVPRHLFVRTFYIPHDNDYTKVEHDPVNPVPEHLETIYSGSALVTHLKDGLPTSSSSESGLVAHMLELLGLDEGMKVLEIGTGTGYNAALLAEIVGVQVLVTTVDYQPDVVAETQDALARAGYPRIRVLCSDGFYGVPETAPYDRVIATVGCPELSPHWVAQLGPGGRVLLPLRHAGANPLLLVSRSGDAILGKPVGFSGFMAIQGELHDDFYWGLPIQSTNQLPEQVQFPVWPDLFRSEGADDKWWTSRFAGFWFYLGIRDRRARGWITSFRLVDPQSGQWVSLDRDHITLTGEQALLDELATYHDEWCQLGSPRIPDFTVRFLPVGHPSIGTSHDSRWVVEGRYYARIFSVD